MDKPRQASVFTRFARWTAHSSGRPAAFGLATLIIAVWGLTGPVFHYSDTWQLVINTSTTIVTFLMVFLIQNTQNRDSEAIHIKLDELICAVKTARNEMLDLEDLDEPELEKIHRDYVKLASKARATLDARAKSKHPAAAVEE
jgi:low affinity Fe/Cu permease